MQETFAIDLQGKWQTEQEFDLSAFGGPWQIVFKNYVANQDRFENNMMALFQSARNATKSWDNMLFFEIAEAAFFYEHSVQGISGTASIKANINVQKIFENYEVQRLAQVDLRVEFQQDTRSLRNIGYRPPKPFFDSCYGEIDPNDDWNCQGILMNQTTLQEGVLIQTPFIVNCNDSTYAILCSKLPEVSFKYFDGRITFDYFLNKNFSQVDLRAIFVLDFCNKNLEKSCQKIFPNFEFEKTDNGSAPYKIIDNFWRQVHNRYTQIGDPSSMNNFDVAYIYILDQFALVNSKFLKNDDKDLESVLVPEIYLTSNSLNCEKCNSLIESQREICQKKHQAIYIHSYVFYNNVHYTNAHDLLNESYHTSFVYGLMMKDQLVNTVYNDEGSWVSHLHCDSSQWTFNDIENVSTPFNLPVDIYSCKIPQCTSTLERLGNAAASVELIYVALVLIIVVSIFCLSKIVRIQGATIIWVLSCESFNQVVETICT